MVKSCLNVKLNLNATQFIIHFIMVAINLELKKSFKILIILGQVFGRVLSMFHY